MTADQMDKADLLKICGSYLYCAGILSEEAGILEKVTKGQEEMTWGFCCGAAE